MATIKKISTLNDSAELAEKELVLFPEAFSKELARPGSKANTKLTQLLAQDEMTYADILCLLVREFCLEQTNKAAQERAAFDNKVASDDRRQQENINQQIRQQQTASVQPSSTGIFDIKSMVGGLAEGALNLLLQTLQQNIQQRQTAIATLQQQVTVLNAAQQINFANLQAVNQAQQQAFATNLAAQTTAGQPPKLHMRNQQTQLFEDIDFAHPAAQAVLSPLFATPSEKEFDIIYTAAPDNIPAEQLVAKGCFNAVLKMTFATVGSPDVKNGETTLRPSEMKAAAQINSLFTDTYRNSSTMLVTPYAELLKTRREMDQIKANLDAQNKALEQTKKLCEFCELERKKFAHGEKAQEQLPRKKK